jgi:hypothetical protein
MTEESLMSAGSVPELMMQLLTTKEEGTLVDPKSAEEFFEQTCRIELQIQKQGSQFPNQRFALHFLHAIGGIFASAILKSSVKQGKPISDKDKAHLHQWRIRSNDIRHLNGDPVLNSNENALLVEASPSESLPDPLAWKTNDFPEFHGARKTVLFTPTTAGRQAHAKGEFSDKKRNRDISPDNISKEHPPIPISRPDPTITRSPKPEHLGFD